MGYLSNFSLTNFLRIDLLCPFSLAIDHEKLLDELEEMLASKKDAKDESHAASIDENAETMFGNIVKSLESDDALPEDSPRDEVSSLYDRIFQDEDEMDKRMVAPKQPDYGLCMDGISIPEGPNQLGCSSKILVLKNINLRKTETKIIEKKKTKYTNYIEEKTKTSKKIE